MKILVPILAAAALTACSQTPEAPRVDVSDAVLTMPAVPGGTGALYFTLTTNREGSRLVSVTSPKIRSIELHETREEGGRSTMTPLAPDDLGFGPDTPLAFAPGGKHGMVTGLDPSLEVGGKVTVTFEVEPVGAVTVEADIRGPGQAHAGH